MKITEYFNKQEKKTNDVRERNGDIIASPKSNEDNNKSCYLIVVDMQNDFCKPDGALYNPDAEALIPKIKERLKEFASNHIIFTIDMHEMGSRWCNKRSIESQKLPMHCVNDSYGGGVVKEFTKELYHGYTQVKTSFAYDRWHFGILGHAGDPDYIELCGTCTDICVISNALVLRSQFPTSRIVVNSNLCAGTSKEAHEAALLVMKNCLIEVV